MEARIEQVIGSGSKVGDRSQQALTRRPFGLGAKSSVAPQKLMRRIEWSEDRVQLRIVLVDDDFGRVEAEPLPAARLEPIRAFRADQGEQAAAGSRPLEFKD